MLVDDTLGLQAYMRIDALARLLREDETLSGAAVTIDPAASGIASTRRSRLLPAIAGVACVRPPFRIFARRWPKT